MSQRIWQSSEYKRYHWMKQRCANPNHDDFVDYGGRGIKVCSRWLSSFTAFYSDMGKCPKGFTLERKDVNGDYSPENCKWASLVEQANNKRNNHRISAHGLTQTVSEWARSLGFKPGLLWGRLGMGWDFERAIQTPVGVQRKPHSAILARKEQMMSLRRAKNTYRQIADACETSPGTAYTWIKKWEAEPLANCAAAL